MKRVTTCALFAGWVATIAIVVLLFPDTQQAAQPAAPGLTVPEGFEIERVAGPPLVERPIVADFDPDGRLYVADSSGSNERVETQLASKPHRIVRLEDSDGDGRFDKSVVFADKMMFPEGAMWFDGSLYVAAPPSIWKLTDTNGDGVADQREEWFEGKTLTGCANDLHGPYLGPDGWIYWTKGAFAQQTYDQPGKAPFVTRAAHIFRRRPGHAAIEPVMTGGMDNPVDVAFTPSGERIFTATFLEHPQAGKRDAIVHAIYGGVYGKTHGVIDGHKRTGDLMPILADLGPAVPAGLTRYESRAFGADYRDSFFAAMFNLRKVTRHVLEPSGATFTMQSSDFVVSTDRDFHPTDVIEDADGSLLVIDTGPWYKLCCPTSQLAKPDVPGGIYRVRRTGAPRVQDPRGRQLDWQAMQPEQVARLLGDPRPAVRQRALAQVATLGSGAVPAVAQVLRTSTSADARRNAVWALTRVDGDQARRMVREALIDQDPGVRQAALHSAGLWRDRAAVPQFVDGLKSGAPAIQRAAAEALGRTGDGAAVPALVAAAAAASDRVLEHSLTYALIEIANPAVTLAEGQRAQSARARRASLIALDQMDGGALQASAVVPLLESTDPVLKDTAFWIASHRQDWGSALTGFFEKRLTGSAATAGGGAELRAMIGQFAENAALQKMLADAVRSPRSAAARTSALEAMSAARGRLKVLPSSWVTVLLDTVSKSDAAAASLALGVLRATPAPKEEMAIVSGSLQAVGRDPSRPADVRIEALAAMPNGLSSVDADLLQLLRSGLEPTRPTLVRIAAASVLERATLDRAQLLVLAESFKVAGPLEIPRLVRAYQMSTDEAVVEAMLAGLEASAARSAVRPELLRAVVAKQSAALRQRADTLIASVHVGSAEQAQRLERLLGSLGEGDIRRGQAVFNSPKAACLSCHAIGYVGGRIGPDLTRIGQVRSERDLLEAIVFPSASFARSYEPVTVTTKTGATHAGVLRSEAADEVVLGTATGDELRIPRTTVADMQPGSVSLMPAGLDEQLTRGELADLLAFLKATRSGAN